MAPELVVCTGAQALSAVRQKMARNTVFFIIAHPY
jgi:hypothetical protein